MTTEEQAQMLDSFGSRVADSVRLEPAGLSRYRVLTPFTFDDGDQLVILLKRDGGAWVLTDEGHTVMHLTDRLDEKDLRSGTRNTIIESVLQMFGVTERDGELVLPIPEERYGDALYSFCQALIKISDITYLSRERVKTTFLEEADFYVQYNGAKADEHQWVQSLRGGAGVMRRSLVSAQEMSAVYAANRILLDRAERTEEAEWRLVTDMRDQLANMEEALMAAKRAVKAEWLVADMHDQMAECNRKRVS